MTYRIAPGAQADLDAIVFYIARHNPHAAGRLIEQFRARWELLATQPWSGPERDDILPGIRHKVTGQYVAFYRVEDGDVLILRVLHGKRRTAPEDFGG